MGWPSAGLIAPDRSVLGRSCKGMSVSGAPYQHAGRGAHVLDSRPVHPQQLHVVAHEPCNGAQECETEDGNDEAGDHVPPACPC